MMTFTNWKILRRLLNSNQVSSRFLHLSLTSLTSPSLSPSPTPTPSTTQSDVFLFGVDVILTSFYGKSLRRVVFTAHRKNLFSPIPAFFPFANTNAQIIVKETTAASHQSLELPPPAYPFVPFESTIS